MLPFKEHSLKKKAELVSVAIELDSNLNGLDDSTLASEGAWFHWLSIFNR